MDKIQIPFSFLYGNPCTSCGEPIAGGQVYLLSDGGTMCDRCRRMKKQFCRNLIYEALASYFLYPCANWRNHCPRVLEWKDAPYHNASCNYANCCGLFFHHPASCFKGKRRFPRENQRTNLMVVPEKIQNFLTCSLCRAYLNCQPVYSQSDKETMCHRCVTTNGNPPNTVRNIPFENIGTLFLFPCSFKRYGCDEILIFGKPAWKHEYECRFNPNSAFNKIEEPLNESPRTSVRPSVHRENTNSWIQNEEEPPRPSVKQEKRLKEKGLIWTQTGPIWATLSPNTALMAPPQRPGEEPNQDVLKSLRKKQGRHRRPINEIGGDMGRRNSESESVSTTMSNSQTNGTATPDLLDTSSKASSFNYLEDGRGYPTRPSSRELGGPDNYNDQYDAEMAGHYLVISRPRNGVVRIPSVQSSRYDAEMASHFPGLYPQVQNNYRMADAEIASHFPFLVRPTNRYHEAEIAGHFPIMLPRQLNDGMDSLGRRVSLKENFQGNRLLISELKMKQDMIRRNHSIRDQVRGDGPC